MSDLADELIAATRSMLDRIDTDTETPAQGVSDALWAALVEAGFTSVDVPTEAGGHGCDTSDAIAVLSTVIGSGALVPFIEHAMLAAWLSGTTGHDLGQGTATIGTSDAGFVVDESGEQPCVTGTVRDVVHVSAASSLVILLPETENSAGRVATISLADDGVSITAGSDLLGASIGTVTLDSVPATIAECPVTTADLRQRGALVYAAALAAAAGTVRDRTVQYASERVQFGRPLTKFQAIQQRLASMAASTTMMEIACRRAAAGASSDRRSARSATAAAKVVTSLYSHEVAAAGHQIHGAIGFTSEHPLGRSTTALWAWRDRYGTEREWADVIAAQILDDGSDPWDLITATATTSGIEQPSTERTSQ
ncbi:acyl-CoA/acyl-ACP dehydrogenase [Gordonia McavH-238-E]|uniref:acyl-CoA dehydrogenase family protein n=1 Tax=Gordonia sp. McavH-238-E TaxID=2917736 RepID=UPI001EF5879E|nr:acyl-CoA dehydrogenase family protein [Gordonia sp. McavH-238-E]MCG7631849.1 acyl-CoA/acyl-ACP dehydrogenase [Gordonia sp. McavH-238-E]